MLHVPSVDGIDGGTGMERKRVFGALSLAVGCLMMIGALAVSGAAGATSVTAQNVPLHNDTAGNGTDCPSGGGAYWHFVIAPNSGYHFAAIHLNVGGTMYHFSGGQIIPNSGDDNVFIAVPSGKTLGQLTVSGSSADITPVGGNPKFNLSHLCQGGSAATTTTAMQVTTTNSTEHSCDDHADDDEEEDEDCGTTTTTHVGCDDDEDDDESSPGVFGQSEDDDEEEDGDDEGDGCGQVTTTTGVATTTTTEAATTTTSEAATTTTTEAATTTTTEAATTTTTEAATTTTAAADSDVSIVAVCREVDTDGNDTKEWFDVTNPNDHALSVAWEDGSTTMAAHATVTIHTLGPGVHFTVDGSPIGQAPTPAAICHRTVTFTKDVAGQPVGDTYTIRVSRLVPPDYVEETTFDITAGQTVSLDLPSTGDGSGFTYTIEEINDGGAAVHTIEPGSITLAGHLGETVSVVITNSFASIELDKQVSATDVQPGDSLDYTLVAHNTGALLLDSPVITDLLPVDVSLESWEVVDDAGNCVLTIATHPQLVTCTMDAQLPVDAFTKMITLHTSVDAGVSGSSTILNQAKVVAFYVAPNQGAGKPQRTQVTASPSELSCIPVPQGAVCDLSAKVGSTLTVGGTTTTAVDSNGGTTSTAATTTTLLGNDAPTTTVLSLPVTGSGTSTNGLLVLGGFMVLLGGMLLTLSRRPRLI